MTELVDISDNGKVLRMRMNRPEKNELPAPAAGWSSQGGGTVAVRQ